MQQVIKKIKDPSFQFAIALIFTGISIILLVVLLKDKSKKDYYANDQSGNGFFYIQIIDNKDKSYQLTYTNNQNASTVSTIYSADGRMFYDNVNDINTSKTALFVLDQSDTFNYKGNSYLPKGADAGYIIGIIFGVLFLCCGLIVLRIAFTNNEVKKVNDGQGRKQKWFERMI